MIEARIGESVSINATVRSIVHDSAGMDLVYIENLQWTIGLWVPLRALQSDRPFIPFADDDKRYDAMMAIALMMDKHNVRLGLLEQSEPGPAALWDALNEYLKGLEVKP